MLKLKLRYFGYLIRSIDSLGKIEGGRRRGQGEEDKEKGMAGWHHRLNGHEFEQAPGVGDEQGSLVCHSPLGHKESDTTEQLN